MTVGLVYNWSGAEDRGSCLARPSNWFADTRHSHYMVNDCSGYWILLTARRLAYLHFNN